MKRRDGMRNFKIEKKRKKSKKIAILALFVCAFALTGMVCEKKGMIPFAQSTLSHPKVTDHRSREEAQRDFNTLANEIFKEEVCSDSLTLNYTVKNREKYGIEKTEASLGEYTLKSMKKDLMVWENRIATLETYDYEKLTEEQQLIYDIIYLLTKQNLETSDLLEYSECLGPTTGIQAQLPVFFAEYNLYQKEDVETYIHLLQKVPTYFEQIADFERMKSKKGIFMSDETAQLIIEQCEKFIKNPSSNYLINVFEKKLENVEGLGEKEKKQWIEKNREAVLKSVIPAYEKLIEQLKALKGTGKNQKGLCYFEKGKEYYAALVRSRTGSERTPDEINKLLDENIDTLKREMADIMAKSPDVYYDAQDVSYPHKKPEEAMKHLREAMKKDFPDLEDDISCEIKYVDKSLQDSLSPAFYLTPAVDNYRKNVVYFNGASKYDLSKAFTTIAHESYPGHLYQNCYFNSTNPSPLRSIINVNGYTEGWGTYVELYSYNYAGIDGKVAKLLQKNTLLTLCIYAKADLAVNYLGWDYPKLQDYLEDFGFQKNAAKNIFNSMVAEPAGYMEYTLGYLEIVDLKDEAKRKLGDKFQEKNFHQFFLETGPAPFEVIRDRMQTWLKNCQNRGK